MAAAPVIQVLEIQDHTNQHLVSLPNERLPPLSPNRVRMRTTLFALSANNLTYARIGHLVGWWGIHPLPESTPAPFNDRSKYGRIMCWGSGEVVESTSPLLKAGQTLFGVFPIGTLPVDKELAADAPGVFFETTAHRRDVLPVYNRYFLYQGDNAESEQSRAWDAVMRGHFETSYGIHRIAFSWDPITFPPINPSGVKDAPWSADDANLTGAIVLVFAASGKTAAAFAQQVRELRPAEFRPRRLIAVGSSASKAFTEGFGWFDEVHLYSDSPAALAASWAVDGNTKIVILDYGARGDTAVEWADSLRPLCGMVQFVRVASDANIKGAEANTQAALAGQQRGEVVVNSSALRDWGIEKLGAERYFQELGEQWAEFKRRGGLPGLRFVWGDGIESVRNGWEQLADAKVDPSTALLFRI
ncbi:hypothetical protein N431DRAFT_435588 [Stipitochalara longipes BDJ]|nr:hypothetical protein N431DRAFT_435588 [Stipitochalara longipes BDJ]